MISHLGALGQGWDAGRVASTIDVPGSANHSRTMTTAITCLWYDFQAEEAADFYTSLIPDAHLGAVTRYPEGSPGELAGKALTVEFEIAGQRFVGLNGGPEFPFTEAVSIQLLCDSQDEVDRYWDALTTDGGAESVCGWLKDRWGLSWQIVPTRLTELLKDPDPAVAGRVNAAMMQMRKIDVPTLEAAAAG